MPTQFILASRSNIEVGDIVKVNRKHVKVLAASGNIAFTTRPLFLHERIAYFVTSGWHKASAWIDSVRE